MKYVLIGFVFSMIWIAYEMWRAPMMDESTGKVLKPTKKLKDLWQKRR